jgi:hypothetical protein
VRQAKDCVSSEEPDLPSGNVADRSHQSCACFEAFHLSWVSRICWQAIPKERRPSLKYWDARLKDTIAPSFADSEERLEALTEDRQELGVLRERPTGEFLDSSVIVRTHNWPSDRGTLVNRVNQEFAQLNAAMESDEDRWKRKARRRRHEYQKTSSIPKMTGSALPSADADDCLSGDFQTFLRVDLSHVVHPGVGIFDVEEAPGEGPGHHPVESPADSNAGAIL